MLRLVRLSAYSDNSGMRRRDGSPKTLSVPKKIARVSKKKETDHPDTVMTI